MSKNNTRTNSKPETKENTSAKKTWVRPLVLFCVAVLCVSCLLIFRGTAGGENGSSPTGGYTKEDIDNLYQEYLEILEQKQNAANDAIVPDNASPSVNSAKDQFIDVQERFEGTSTEDLAKNAQSMLDSMKSDYFGDAAGSNDVLDSDASTESVQSDWNAEDALQECQDLLAQLTGNN